MASFLKKALGVFVEFDDKPENKQDEAKPTSLFTTASNTPAPDISKGSVTHAEAEKFEKYFDNLFDKANLPGPDYFEFYKTMETLEPHIADEKARVSATFASLAIQGLTKQSLLDTAGKYKEILENDLKNFEQALEQKMKLELGDRQSRLKDLEQKIISNSEQIQKLTKEITETQGLISQIKNEVTEQESKLSRNKTGYQLASQAVLSKIAGDIQKIQTTL